MVRGKTKDVVYPISVEPPTPVGDVVSVLDGRIRGSFAETLRPVGTGFEPLDEYMSGGFHAEDLVLVGGMQGVGKTVSILQMARAAALQGRLSVIVCYEHSPVHLLFRMLCMESFWNEEAERLTWPVLRDTLVRLGGDPQRSFDQILLHLPAAREAWERLSEYMEGIWLVMGDGVHTTVDVLDMFVADAVSQGYECPMLFVDYVQIVPVRPDPMGVLPVDKERISVVMKALKATAIRRRAIVVAVAAADEQSLRRQRVHLENLWGPSLMQYQPDTALILNRGSASAAGRGATMIRCGLEKQRNGPQGLEFEFALHGAHFCFNPRGRLVGAEESYQRERVALQERTRENPEG
jgi:replicative DNA helicase